MVCLRMRPVPSIKAPPVERIRVMCGVAVTCLDLLRERPLIIRLNWPVFRHMAAVIISAYSKNCVCKLCREGLLND